jgi:hypothetical protein
MEIERQEREQPWDGKRRLEDFEVFLARRVLRNLF